MKTTINNTEYARIIYPDSRIYAYTDQKLAYSIWLSLPIGTRVAFRGIGDTAPVYPHDYVDKK